MAVRVLMGERVIRVVFEDKETGERQEQTIVVRHSDATFADDVTRLLGRMLDWRPIERNQDAMMRMIEGFYVLLCYAHGVVDHESTKAVAFQNQLWRQYKPLLESSYGERKRDFLRALKRLPLEEWSAELAKA